MNAYRVKKSFAILWKMVILVLKTKEMAKEKQGIGNSFDKMKIAGAYK